MGYPLATIVIPTYNRAGLLPKTLDSARNQDYRPIEILVIDDGSTDDTFEVINQWRANHADDSCNLRYSHHQNSGPSASRNVGLYRSKGEFVYFLDSDDHMYPHLLSKAIRTVQSENSDCVIFGFHFVGENQKLARYLPPKGMPALEGYLLGKLWGYTYCSLSRAELVKRVGDWNTKIRVGEDYEFLGRTLLTAGKVSVLYEPLLKVHRTAGSLGQTKNTASGLADRLIAERSIVNLLKERPDVPPHLLRAYASRLYKSSINMYVKRRPDYARDLGTLATQIDKGPWSALQLAKRFVWRHRRYLGSTWARASRAYSFIQKITLTGRKLEIW